MARRRREVAPDAAAQADASVTTDAGEPQATLTVRGSADAVKKQMGIGNEEKPESEKKDGNGHDQEKIKFVDALRGSKYIIRVKRMTPREFNGQKTSVEVWQAELPLGYQEIQEEVTKEFGGGKYRVAVIDPSSNNTVAADVFVVEGDPIVPEADMTEEDRQRLFMQGAPKSAADLSEEGLERRARLTAKQIEVEAYEEQLETARKRRDQGSKPASQDNTRVEELERRVAEAKHQAELESRDRKHAEEMRELKEMIAQNSRPAKSEGPSEISLILAQMQKSQESADKRFEALQKQMQDDKMNAVLEELKSIKNRPQPQNNMLEMAETMLKLNKMISGVRDDDDEDDGDDKDDDRPWWERAIDKLGGKFGDQFLDKLAEKFSGMEGKGEQVTREEFMKNMNEEAQRIADEAVNKAKRANALPPPQALPAPPLPPLRPAVTAPAAQVTALPPPPPATLPPPPPPQVQAPAQEPPPKLTIEQEIVLRTGGVLEMIAREMELRPHEYHWNYEGAFCSLPEDILEKVCAAPDPVAMIDAFALPMISAEELAKMKTRISENPRMLAWLKTGHDELKVWHAEKLKDPTFDPFAEDTEEGEGE